MNCVDARIVLNEMYESKYGIYNHFASGTPQRPLAGVAMHPAEDINQGSLLEEAINTYTNRNIKDTFGLNFLEFISLPMDVCEMLTGAALAILKDKNKQATAVQEQMEGDLT